MRVREFPHPTSNMAPSFSTLAKVASGAVALYIAYELCSVVLSPSPSLRKHEGNAHCKAGRFEEAIVCYSKAMDANPTPTEAAAVLTNRALCHLKLGSPTACIVDCTASLEHVPDVLTTYRRAEAYLAEGRLVEAMDDLANILREHPSHTPAAALARRVEKIMNECQAAGDTSSVVASKQATEACFKAESADMGTVLDGIGSASRPAAISPATRKMLGGVVVACSAVAPQN